MKQISAPSRHLRPRGEDEQQTTAVELLFDLVYVFAITQLSHLVIAHFDLTGTAHAVFLLWVIWWAWIYTTWMVNWFDPGSGKVRLVLISCTLASLLMSAAIPTAFGGNALLFAGCYTALQVGRNVASAALLRRSHALRIVLERICVWSAASGSLWIAGGLAPESLRLAFWGPALFVDLVAPLLGYRTPGLGRAHADDYPVEGGHFAERFQSFVIIALGESVVVTGASAAAKGLDGLTIVALGAAFLVSGGLWWLYFGEVAENSRARLRSAEDTGALARDAYTYLHLPIVAGIIMVAVGDDLLISSPDGTLSAAGMTMTVGGPALYLAGENLFRLRMIGSVSRKRMLTILLLAVFGAVAGELSALAVSLVVAAMLGALAAWEYPPVQPRAAD